MKNGRPFSPNVLLHTKIIANGPPSAFPVMLRIIGEKHEKVLELADKMRQTMLKNPAVTGVVLVVDGIQAAGVFTPDLQGVAAFVTGGHKGLLGPAGQGFVWTTPELRSTLLPAGSWLSVADGSKWARPGTDLDRAWLPDGRRLEPGAYNLVGAAILGESLALLCDAGPQRIAAHVRALQGRLIAGLRDGASWPGESDRLEPLWAADRLGPFLSLHAGPNAAGLLFDRLKAGADRNIHASVREGYLRIALHGWHDVDDVHRLLEWLR